MFNPWAVGTSGDVEYLTCLLFDCKLRATVSKKDECTSYFKRLLFLLLDVGTHQCVYTWKLEKVIRCLLYSVLHR